MSQNASDSDSAMKAQSNVQFDIKKFVYKLIGFLPWIIISLLLSYTIAKLYLRYTPQMHRVAAFLLIKDDEESSPDYNVLKELGVITSSKEIQNQIDILQSYELSEDVVDSLDLQVKLFTEGRISSLPIYGKSSPVFIHVIKSDSLEFIPGVFQLFLYKDGFELVQNNIRTRQAYNDTFSLSGKKVFFLRNGVVKADDNGYNLTVQDKHSVAVGLRSAVAVAKAHDPGGIVEIAMVEQSPERGTAIINKLIESYNTAGVTDKNLVGFKTRHFLNDRVDTVAQELDELEQKAEFFKKKNQINDISTLGGQYLNESMKYDEQQAVQAGQIKLLESLTAFIKSSKNYTDIIPSQYGLSEGTLSDLISTHNKDVVEYQDQIKISTPKDPVVERLKGKINDDKSNILKNIESIKSSYEINTGIISTRKNDFDKLLYNLPEKEREFLKLKRQIGVKEQLYLYLLQKKEEIELSLNSTINNARVVDSAFDQGVVSPKTDQVVIFALIIGLIIPLTIMLLLDFFDNKLSDRKEIEEATSVPIIGELSFNTSIKNKIIYTKSRSSMAEQFRLVGTNLRYISPDKSTKVILVTSFMSGEGKSFVSTNLAGSLSTGNTKVLLIELDLRKPKLSRYLDIHPKYGLTDYLVNAQPLEQVIFKLKDFDHVDVITSGPVPPNPSELLMLSRLETLFEFARNNYTYVLIDSSPVGLVADAFLAGRFTDITLFILRHRYSHKTTLNYVERLKNEKKLQNLNIIVNGIKEQKGVGYTYGYSYGYGYGYSYGYGYGYKYGSGYYPEDEKPKKGLKRFLPFFGNK